MSTQATFFATLVDEWVRAGVHHAVVAPGNRSTLLSAMLAEHPQITTHVIVDERSAAFFALGIGKATGSPAVFWCTSGTAAAEAHAAMIEADQAGVPLLVCTADRPPELHHARDWQSVDQRTLYGSSPRWSFDPGVADDAMAGTWRSIASRAVAETTTHPDGPGPVHLNLPIREPWDSIADELPPARGDGPWHRVLTGELQPDLAVIGEIASGTRGVFVVGEDSGADSVLQAAAEHLGWPVLAEVRSGARTPHTSTVAYGEAVVRQHGDSLQPDVIVRLGTPGLSKPVARWLKSAGAGEYVIDPHGRWVGAVVDAATIVRADPTMFSEALTMARPNTEDGWLAAWRTADDAAEQQLTRTLSGEFTESAIAHTVATSTPDGHSVFAATSMPVRHLESVAPSRYGVRYFANRGASGMDGITATAAGVAVGTGRPVTLLVGDLTFLYDLNTLWAGGVDLLGTPLTVVVMDNGGGGIFDRLPQLESIDRATFDKVVRTPRPVDIPAVVEALGVPCQKIASTDELAATLEVDANGFRVLYARPLR